MHVQEDSSYSNTGMDLIFEDERHILVEEQKACRARARKFSLETNRRRKALEERRKEEDEREQKLREDILQQRKNKVQDATERFQRAHLPPSQRRRQAPRKATPQLEEALNQIQGPPSSSSAHATLFNSLTNNRSHAPSPSASRYQRQLSAAVAYAKLMQERSSDNFKSSQLLFQNELQETQRLLEEKRVNSLQDFQREVGELGRSESLSSLDSLENESSHHAHTDSVELAKQKDKDPESNKAVKKKLRWFDEVHLNEEEEAEEDARPLRDPVKDTAARSKATQPSQGKSVLVGNQEDLVQAAHLVTTPAVCVGHCAKQAWSDSRAQDSKLQVRGEEGQQGKTSPRRGRARVPRRVRSARARLGHAPARTRKGTVVRPQSASEASQVFKTQGKIIMPRPPPKSGTLESKLAPGSSCAEEALLNPAKSVCSDVQFCSRPGPPAEQALHKDVSGGCAIPAGHSIVMASGITFAPFPPSYALSTYENITKAMYTIGGSHSAGQQEALGASGRRGPQYVENGLNMEQTPTDEEISQLWHGVTIDGGNLISDIKAVTRMGGFFVTTSNGAKSPVRKKQITDSNGKKHRALLEQRRLAPGSGTRRPPVPAQTSVQISPLGSKADQISGVVLQDEVSDSTAQFLLAENLAESSATDADILAAMETVQTQRQGMAPRVQHLGPTALSLEEQRLLLSLDRLNHRLQSVQDASAGNPSVPSLLQIGAPSQNLSSRPGEGQGTPQRRYRVCSADGRGRPQK
ncbi:hypothetical protein MATL_G00043180 [Megalops atlanticus]|uniref:Centrosomal protein of 126 kDa n=1 Tax=Megalops atlanticus TaxID=7932 RepID=A0A9D3TB74_MEGAT|nr:hypothetical protein MATL_G00043180 [Megalops atlanticus]